MYWGLEREIRDCPEVVRFEVPGDPTSKARARFTGKGSKVRTFTPENTREAEERVAWYARRAGLRGLPDGESSFGLLCVFFTASWQRRDADNMLKLVADGLNKIAYVDDSQVTEMSARIMRADSEPRTHVLLYRTLAQRPPQAPCPVCGKSVRSYASVTYKTCSQACAQIARRSAPWQCRTCGKTEMRTPAAARLVYCNDVCRRADPTPRVRGSGG